MAVAVAGVDPLGTALAVAGPADGVGLGRHQPLGEAAHHLAQQVRVVLLEVLAQPLERVQAVNSHRISPLGCRGTSLRLVRWSSRVVDPARQGVRVTGSYTTPGTQTAALG